MSQPIPCEETSENYRYSALTRNDSIRILTLQPGSANEPLVCSLQPGRLDELPPYEAISYVWGSNTRDHEIACDEGKLHVTRNLHSALCALRLPSQARALWADSVCINQEDVAEKSVQVALMGAIYRRSSCALIYLGQDTNGDAERATSLVREVNEMIRSVLAQSDNRSWDSFPEPAEDDALVQDERWWSVNVLLDQPWFYRGWVVQEAALAPNARIIWGRSEIAWLSLIGAYNWMQKRAPQAKIAFGLKLSDLHRSLYARQNFDHARTFMSQGDWMTYRLLDYLLGGREFGLFDARDRIYAFLALPRQPNEEAISIQPDYSKSSAKVYAEFATEYLCVVNNLDILTMIAHNEDTIADGVSPSWAPRWDVWTVIQPLGYSTLPRLSSSNGLVDIPPTVPSPGVLEVCAVVMDKIRFVSDPMDWGTTSLADVTAVWAEFSMQDVPQPYPPRARSMAFMTALTAGQYRGSLQAWLNYRAAFMSHLEKSIGDSSPRDVELLQGPSQANLPGDAGYVHNFGRRYAHRRRLFVTDRGYYALGPLVARISDICCVIFGARMPFILRPSVKKAGHYKVVGETWITGKNIQSMDNGAEWMPVLGAETSKDWTEWGLKEECTLLC